MGIEGLHDQEEGAGLSRFLSSNSPNLTHRLARFLNLVYLLLTFLAFVRPAVVRFVVPHMFVSNGKKSRGCLYRPWRYIKLVFLGTSLPRNFDLQLRLRARCH